MVEVPRDPNWLYSTTAQSTAALVAIIGGFLVSRVLNIASRRESLEGRLREVDAEIARATPPLEHLTRRNLERDAEYFIQGAYSEICDHVWSGAELDELTAESLVSRGVTDRRSDVTVYDPFLAPVAAEARIALSSIGTLASHTWPSTSAELRSFGFDVPEEWEGLLSRRSRENPSRSILAGMFDPSLSASLLAGSMLPYRGPTRWEEEAALRSTMGDLEARRGYLVSELAELTSSGSLREPITVLAFFSVVGLVAPIVLLALDPVPTGPWARGLVVAGFFLGLGALLRYLLAEARRAQRSRRVISSTLRHAALASRHMRRAKILIVAAALTAILGACCLPGGGTGPSTTTTTTTAGGTDQGTTGGL